MYKVSNLIISKYNKISESLTEIDDLLYEAGQAHALACIIWMLDNKSSDTEIRKFVDAKTEGFSLDAIEHYIEIKASLSKKEN